MKLRFKKDTFLIPQKLFGVPCNKLAKRSHISFRFETNKKNQKTSEHLCKIVKSQCDASLFHVHKLLFDVYFFLKKRRKEY